MKLGINIPQFGLLQSNHNASILGDFVEKAEKLGYDSIWAQDKCFQKQISFIDPLTGLAFAAARTKEIELGVAAIILPLKDPVMVAKIATDVDFLSNNRLILGVVLGNPQDYLTNCVPLGQRVPRFLEALEIVRMLCIQEDVSYEGKYFRLSHASIIPRPRRKNGFPIWIGGGDIGSEVSDKVIRRAAKYGDGWLGAGSTDVGTFRNSCQKYQNYCKELGKDVQPERSIAKRIYIHVNTSKEKARQVLKKYLSIIYGIEFDVDRLCIFGSDEECASKLADVLPSGKGTIILNPVTDFLEQEEVLAKDVIEKLK